MPLCHIVCLLIVGAVVLFAAAYLAHRDERRVRFRENIEIDEDERFSEGDLP
jgi:hypothetical protein